MLSKTSRGYLKRTKDIRKGKPGLVNFFKLHKTVSRQTLSCLMKDVLVKVGIDTEVYPSHSTRAASVSVAAVKGLTLGTIMA